MNAVLRVARNLCFSVLFAAAFFALAEGALRLAGWPDPGIYDGDTRVVWTLRRNLAPRRVPFPERNTTFNVRTNALGYRGGPPADGAILCLGDSTTFGWGVEEEEAWPARLAVAIGAPVVNAGVPGYSTVQGLATIDHALTTHPRTVILAYVVRDAERAAVPDSARPAQRGPDLALLRAIRTLRPQRVTAGGSSFRVPPDEYRDNLRALLARVRAAGADPVLLAFPMQEPPAGHLAVLDELGAGARLLAPTLPSDAFFAEDPIHLTADGNARLAGIVAAELAP